MSKPIFFTDLDQTMIFSRRMIEKYTGSYNGLAVVETHLEQPWSFMTIDAVNVLQTLSREITVVPCSTRSPSQWDKLGLHNVIHKYTILDNGGKIYVNGREDKSWTRKTFDLIDTQATSPAKVSEEITKEFGEEDWFSRIRVISNMFVSARSSSEIPASFLVWIEEKIVEWNYSLSIQLKNDGIYLIPKPVSKEAGAAEVKGREAGERTFAAGDSILDLKMMEEATHAIRPAHGELYELGLGADIKVTTKSGVRAGEQILEYVKLLLT